MSDGELQRSYDRADELPELELETVDVDVRAIVARRRYLEAA